MASTLDHNIIFVEILPKLPTKTLIRFKCVSKSFNSAISSPEVIDLHLRHHYRSSSDHLLILAGNHHINCYNLRHSLPLSTPISTFTWPHPSSIYVIGSSNGLLSVFVSKDDDRNNNHIGFLNPTTRCYTYTRIPLHGNCVFSLGFGFDRHTLDHKLVIVFHRYDEFDDEFDDKTQFIRVYSLNTDSWRPIQTQSQSDSIISGCVGVVINHNLVHWMMQVPSLNIHKIGCFNLSTNNWTNDVLLPRYYYDPTHENYILSDIGVLDGRYLVSYFWIQTESRYDVWVMKEYGVQDSWLPLWKGSMWSEWNVAPEPVFSRGGLDEVLISQWRSGKLYWYDTRSGRISDAIFHGDLFYTAQMCCVSHIELPGSKLFEES
ncbi:hypothetical protein RND81_06G210100 [Saponaria officinalis]|uniref:F-box domain-containing protein n=1 Tax=Saponaria officinalis TaxID=3572 RepID=A0AAW1KE86_SAPOF